MSVSYRYLHVPVSMAWSIRNGQTNCRLEISPTERGFAKVTDKKWFEGIRNRKNVTKK